MGSTAQLLCLLVELSYGLASAARRVRRQRLLPSRRRRPSQLPRQEHRQSEFLLLLLLLLFYDNIESSSSSSSTSSSSTDSIPTLFSDSVHTQKKKKKRQKRSTLFPLFLYCRALLLLRECVVLLSQPTGALLKSRSSKWISRPWFPQLDSTRSLIVYTFFNIIIISWLYASSQSDQVGSRFGIWRGWAWKIENNNKTLLLHVATNWRIIDLSSSSPPSTRVYARHHPTGRNANRDKQFPCQHATRHPPSSFL